MPYRDPYCAKTYHKIQFVCQLRGKGRVEVDVAVL